MQDGASVRITWDAVPMRLSATIIMVVIALLVLAIRLCAPILDSKEPPLLIPRIPVIGHLVGIIRHQNDYQRILSDKNPSYPCVTLPILNGKLYGVWDPFLIQQVLRAKIASFEAFEGEFIDKVFGMSQETAHKIKSDETLFSGFTNVIHGSFQKDNLRAMNAVFLSDIARKINPLSACNAEADPHNLGKETILDNGVVEIENFYLWCRDVMTLSTTRALFGRYDPFAKDKSLLDAIWRFEGAVPYFLLNLAPHLTMPKNYQARQSIQDALVKFFDADHHNTDPTVAAVTRNRANFLRERGLTTAELGQSESILPVVASTNSVPTLFWVLIHILQDQDLVCRVRDEALAFAQVSSSSSSDSADAKTATFDISKLDEGLPLIVSCYRETLRLVNHSVLVRRMMEDMTITTQEGESFLLKKGVDVHLPAAIPHRQSSIWGSSSRVFDPERFLATSVSKSTEADRVRKVSYIPFGGGRHLCPGRNFAFTEIVIFVAMMVLGFDIETVNIPFQNVQPDSPQLASSTVKPAGRGEGLRVRITPRKDFIGVKWAFDV